MNLSKSVSIKTALGINSYTFLYNENGFFRFDISLAGLIEPKKLGQGFTFNGMSNISDIYKIAQIRAVEIMVDEVSVSTFKRAAVGSLLFGGVGAIAGALSTIKAKPKSKIAIVVYIDSIELSSVYIPCRNMDDAIRLASTISSLESSLVNPHDKEIHSISLEIPKSNKSITDEVFKLKKMLDDGIIDENEFKLFKKKIISGD
jgi:hypothetical protein